MITKRANTYFLPRARFDSPSFLIFRVHLPEHYQNVVQTQAREERAKGEGRHGQAILRRPTNGECPVRQRKLDLNLSL